MLRTEYVSVIFRWMPLFNGMTSVAVVLKRLHSANNVTFHVPSFLRRQETIFSSPINFQMDAVFQRHDVRDSCAEKVASANNATYHVPLFL